MIQFDNISDISWVRINNKKYFSQRWNISSQKFYDLKWSIFWQSSIQNLYIYTR